MNIILDFLPPLLYSFAAQGSGRRLEGAFLSVITDTQSFRGLGLFLDISPTLSYAPIAQGPGLREDNNDMILL